MKEFEIEYFNDDSNVELQQSQSLKEIYKNNELKKARSKYLYDQSYWMNKMESLGNYPQLPIKMNFQEKHFHFRRQLGTVSKKFHTFMV